MIGRLFQGRVQHPPQTWDAFDDTDEFVKILLRVQEIGGTYAKTEDGGIEISHSGKTLVFRQGEARRAWKFLGGAA